MGLRGAGFDKNVLQFYVPVEHTPGVDPDESIHQLFDDSLSGRNIRGKLGTHFLLCKGHIEILTVVIFKRHCCDIYDFCLHPNSFYDASVTLYLLGNSLYIALLALITALIGTRNIFGIHNK